MLKILVSIVFALALSEPAEAPSLLIATDKDLSTSVRLVESSDDVGFEFTGPTYVAPSISIDVNRNGVIDRNLDFQVGINPDGSFCLQHLLSESASTICKPLGGKVKVVEGRRKEGVTTTFSFPKREISGDGFGFGFAINLWNTTGNYQTTLASGDYRFGGTLQLVRKGPNFKGEQNPDVPPQLMPAIRRYEGCLSGSIKALEPLDSTKITKLKAVPAGCVTVRTIALHEGVKALVATGYQEDEATKAMNGVLDQLDTGITRMVEIVKKGS